MCKNTGIFGSCIRLVLTLINILLLVIGAAIFIASAFLRWNPEVIIGNIPNDDAVQSILNASTVNIVSIIFLSIGGFIVLISTIGLIGALCASRAFLIIYQFFIIIIFLIHAVAMLVLTIMSNGLSSEFKKELNTTMNNINNYNISSNKYEGN